MKDLGIVIINWNTQKLLHDCLASLEKSKGISKTVVVVDNGSTDGSAEMVKENFPQINLITNTNNLGFSKANNQGLKLLLSADKNGHLECRYVLLLNSDTIVPEESLAKMVDYMDHNEEVGALGPKLLNPDGTVQREGFYRKLPSLVQVVLFYTPFKRIAMRSRYLVGKYWEDVQEDVTMEIDQIPGAVLLVRSEVMQKVGLLEERFPIWFEDVDWAYRAKSHNVKQMYFSEASIIHYGGGSFSKWQEKGRMLQLFSSMYIFFDLHKGRWQAELMRILILLSSLLSVVFNFIRKYLRLPGFKLDDYEARKFFIAHFMKRIQLDLPKN